MASMTREEVAALLGGDRLYSAGRDRLYTVDELMGAPTSRPLSPTDGAAMVFVETAAYGQPGSPFHLARARAGRAAAPFDDLVTLADSPEAVVAEMRVSRRRTGYEADEQ